MSFRAGLNIIIEILPLFLFFGSGWLLCRLMFPNLTNLEYIGLAFPLAVGLSTWGLFILSVIGLRLSGPVVISWLVLQLTVPLFIVRKIRARDAGGHQTENGVGIKESVPELAVIALVGLIMLAAMVVSMSYGYSSWDAAAIWAAKGYGIAKEGTIIAAEKWGAHGLAYPLNVPMVIAIFRIIAADVLPASKAIFPTFLFSILLVIGGHGLSRGSCLESTLALLLLAGTSPIIFRHGTVGYANMAFSHI